MATVIELDNEQAYEAEIGECVGVSGYHHWFFLRALADSLNYEFRAVAVEAAGERLGVVPLFFQRRGPVSTANFIPVGSVGPVIRGEALRAGRMGELLQGVQPILRRHRTVAARWAFAPNLSLKAEELAAQGYDVFPWDNFIIPGTKSVDDLLKSMSRNRRQAVNRHIRRGEDRGVSVQEATPEEIKRWVPEQILAIYQRQGRKPLYDLPAVQSLTERLATDPRMLWRTVKDAEGAVVGTAGCILADDRLWGWLISGSPVNGVSVQTLVYWNLIKWSLDRGLTLDLGGAPSEGYRELKTSLGADIEPAFRVFEFHPKAAYKAVAALRGWGPVNRNWERLRVIIGD